MKGREGTASPLRKFQDPPMVVSIQQNVVTCHPEKFIQDTAIVG